MTFDELRDNYAIAFNAQLEQCSGCRWLDWTPGGAYFVLAKDAMKKPPGRRSPHTDETSTR